ncbi:MAG: hypothetical protein INR69_06155 [Mucilaginibacter polytrichastri]|nr:hypothetical protein [Mucilaginibacter polytrichastri]
MDSELVKDKPVVRLRAYRAIDEPETSLKFIKGHEHVLTSIGVQKVTSSKNEWMENPAAFVLVVETMDGQRVLGGARVHVAGGSELLPIEQATGKFDPYIHDLVRGYAQQGTGEICGLWNSREISGYGIGCIFLIRAAVAISEQIGIQSLFALCAPYTIKPVVSCGMQLEDSVGNKGTFYYPKLDLLATSMILKDVPTLHKAEDDDREAIMKIRREADVIRIEELRRRQIEIHYQTTIPGLDSWDLKAAIANTQKTAEEVTEFNEDDLEIF